MGHYYKASGKSSPIFILYFILTAAILFPLLGLAYAYAIWYIPFIYINLLIAAALGFGVAMAINFVTIRMGKVRSPNMAYLLGFLAGAITLYFHWAVWADLVLNAGESYGSDRIGVTVSNIEFVQVFALALDPVTLFSLIGEINEFGTWGIRSAAVSGMPLTIIWIIEALVIVGIATLIPAGAAKQPYCEMGNSWFDEVNFPPMSFVDDTPAMIAALESDNGNSFDTLTKAENLEADHSLFTLYTSSFDEHYLTIENKKAKKNDKGEIEFDDDEFVEYISITNPMKEALLKK